MASSMNSNNIEKGKSQVNQLHFLLAEMAGLTATDDFVVNWHIARFFVQSCKYVMSAYDDDMRSGRWRLLQHKHVWCWYKTKRFIFNGY